jgi:hypothetical protein
VLGKMSGAGRQGPVRASPALTSSEGRDVPSNSEEGELASHTGRSRQPTVSGQRYRAQGNIYLPMEDAVHVTNQKCRRRSHGAALAVPRDGNDFAHTHSRHRAALMSPLRMTPWSFSLVLAGEGSAWANTTST